MPRDLPERPNLDQLRRQAKELHRAAAAGDPQALHRLNAVSDDITLAAAQLALAREYGFGSWRRLRTEVERKTALVDGDLETLARVVAASPELAAERVSSPYSGPAASALGYAAVARFHGLIEHRKAADIARVLLDAGAPVDGDPGDFETPLITAASYYETGMVRVLIEAGADLEATGREIPGGTALTHAVWLGQPQIADLLVGAGAVVRSIIEAAGAGDLAGFLTSETPVGDREGALLITAGCERLALIDELLATGISVDAAPGGYYGPGVTALHWAAWHGKVGSVRALLTRGADSNLRDDRHHGTPLDWYGRRQDEAGKFPGQRIDPEVGEVLASVTSAR